MDAVFFVNYAKSTTTTDTGFGNKRTRAVGGGQRRLYTQERPAFVAKNRYNLPDMIEMPPTQEAWHALLEHIPYLKTKYGNKGEKS
jgi:hypothetical protein